jgi:hypothetical protein
VIIDRRAAQEVQLKINIIESDDESSKTIETKDSSKQSKTNQKKAKFKMRELKKTKL